MTLKHYYNGTLLTTAVQLASEKGFSAHAQTGDVDTILVTVEDPSAAYDFVGLKPWRMVEDSCPSNYREAWYGYVWRQGITRGEGDTGDTLSLTSTARRWELELVESNSLLARRILTSNESPNRPSEDVSTRLTWLLTTSGFVGQITDQGLIESCSTICNPVDYTGRSGLDVLRDLATVSGFNFFTRFVEATQLLQLAFYDAAISTLDASTLNLSNVKAEIDETTTWASGTDTTLMRDPSRVASGVFLPYTGGSYYTSSGAIASNFSPIDQTAPTAAVTTAASAAILAARYLGDHDEQSERITSARVVLPVANLNDVRQGQAIDAKYVHLPGYTSARAMRVASKSFSRPESLAATHYAVDLELTPMIAPISTHARLERPNDNDYAGSQVYRCRWDNDGDNYGSGDPNDPKYGFVAYYPSPKPSSGWRGLQMTGSGTLSIVELMASMIDVVTGNVTISIQIRKNGTMIAEETQTTSGGLRSVVFETTVTITNLVVAAGDILEGWITSSENPPAQDGFTIPAGVGSSSHRLLITGNLAGH